jgi:hypothetical protein
MKLYNIHRLKKTKKNKKILFSCEEHDSGFVELWTLMLPLFTPQMTEE